MSPDNEHLEILERLFDAKLDPVVKLCEDHEKRLRKTETSITQIKTIWTMLSVTAGFIAHSVKDFLLGGSGK